ncbi:MAG: oligopeptidase B, partial [Candidatus Sericytochromatia bacterium]
MSAFMPVAIAQPQPPVAERIPKELTLHGDTRVDPYFWLREEDNPKVLDYLKAENTYTENYMADTAGLQDKLFKELSGYLVETDQTVPRKKRDYYYYSRAEKGKNYRIYCRRKGNMSAPEQVLLDLNALAEGKEYLNLGVFKISPDQRYLAYSLDDTGAEAYTLRVKDLETGQLLPEAMSDTYYSAEWAADSRTLFYNVIDAANRPFKLFRHQLGSDPKSDALIFHEPDERFNVDMYKTSSEQYLILKLESNTTAEARYIPADKPTNVPVMIQPRTHELEYSVEHEGSFFIIHTNDGATNFKLVRTPIVTPDRGHWQTIVPERPDAKLESMRVFDKYLTAVYRSDARMLVEAYHLLNGRHWQVRFPEEVASIWPADEQDFAGNTLRVSYSSLVTPWSVFDYRLESETLELKKQDQIQGYDPSDYVSERLYATAGDGTKVPITLIYRKGLQKDGKNPLYLYSYGSYGVSTDPDYYASVTALLKRGFVFA